MIRTILLGLLAASPALAAGPAISALSLVTPSLNVRTGEGVPIVAVTYSSGAAALQALNLTLTSPAGNPMMLAYQPGLNDTGGTIRVGSQALSRYAQPGLWHVTALQAFDRVGNATVLDAAQVAALLGNAGVTVTNPGPSPSAPPGIGAGLIDTPTVSASGASPEARFALSVSAGPTGVSFVGLSLAGTPESIGFGNPYPAFTTQGVISLSLNVRSVPPGTYTINSVSVCNNDNLCSFPDAAAIARIFKNKTTLVVTK